jgi:hypothetical protein
LAVATLTSSLYGQSIVRADEYRVKAAILYNLAKFIEWPDDVFGAQTDPLIVCVLGTDPFGPVLDQTLSGHLVGGRPITAKRVGEVTPACHMLFISTSEHKRLPVLVDELRGMSVLTVSDDEDFIAQGGMIGLVTEGERVRFAINSEAADHARLKVSARLLALAIVKKPRAAP